MYFSEAAKAVLYTLRQPELVAQAIPAARRIDQHRLAVPVRHDTMEVAHRLGLPIVNPMRVLYDWPLRPGRSLLAHQPVMSGFMAMQPKCFNLSDMGTTKTICCLWAADYLMLQGLVGKVLIVSTLSTMDAAWGDEIYHNFLGRRSFSVLHGSVERRMERLAAPADFYILNHDGVSVRGMADALVARADIDLVIVDEASAFKHSGTQRWKALKAILRAKKRVWLLTGTPAANHPTDAWGLAKLIDATPMSQFAFRDRTMVKVSQFKWVPRHDAPETVATTLQPAIRFKREECIDLPECMTETREVSLSEKQRKAYDDMKRDLALTLKDGRVIDAVNEAVLRTKLIQIACGALYDPDHEVHHLDAGPKVDELRQVLESISAKAIVFAPLTSVVNMLYRALVKDGYSTAMVTGSVAQKARTDIFRSFQEEAEPRVIVADPRAMAHGLTLTAANTVIWFGPIDSLEIYLQANARINRPGQKNRMLVVHIASTPVEREIYRRLAEKESLQGAVLKIVENSK